MVEYDIKRGHYKNVEGEKLFELLCDIFGEEYLTREDDRYYVRYGSLDPLEAQIMDKTTLYVGTEMNSDVDLEEGLDSRNKYNRFLDAATGFNSKKRVKRLKDKAKGK